MRDLSGATVSGGNILSMLTAMGAFRKTGEQILSARGITSVQPAEWYPFDAYISALNDIETKIGPKTLFKIGKEIPNHIDLPPEINSFETVIGSFGPAFSMNHRGAGAGGITFAITAPGVGTIISGTPYPCDFDQGVIQGFFRKLVKGAFRYEHDASNCKKNGDATCLHQVSVAAIR